MPLAHAALVREFNRFYTQRIGVLTDRYLDTDRPLGESRLLYEIGTGGAEVAVLRARLELDSGYLSRLLRALERRGLAQVGPRPGDRRARRTVLTPAGRDALEDLNARATRAADHLLAGLDSGQRDELIGHLDRAMRLLRLAAVDIAVTDPESPDAEECLHRYVAELRVRFPEGYRHEDLVAAGELRSPRGLLLVATERGRPVGCGALRVLGAGVGELRHMWIHPDARGLGLGRRLLCALEAHAGAFGLRTVRLGTHRVLAEALSLYRSAGYTEIPPYGDTAHQDNNFEKSLAAAPPS